LRIYDGHQVRGVHHRVERRGPEVLCEDPQQPDRKRHEAADRQEGLSAGGAHERASKWRGKAHRRQGAAARGRLSRETDRARGR